MAESVHLRDIPVDGLFHAHGRTWRKWCESPCRSGIWLCLSDGEDRTYSHFLESDTVIPGKERIDGQ